MKITKFAHSCLLVEQGDVRIVIDPGVFSAGAEDIRDVDALLITHSHADHLDMSKVHTLVEQNPGLKVLADPMSAEALAESGIEAIVATPGETYDFGIPVEALAGAHAVIHPELPQLSNVAFLVDKKLYHPGDSLALPEGHIEVLALPVVAPWMTAGDAVEYLRKVRPTVAIPIHEAIASSPDMYYGYLKNLGPADTRLEILRPGDSILV